MNIMSQIYEIDLKQKGNFALFTEAHNKSEPLIK